MIRRIASYLLVVVIMVSVILVLSENRGAKEKGVRLSTEQDAQITGTTDEISSSNVEHAVQHSLEANRHYFTQNTGQLGAEEIHYYYQAPGRGIAFLESAVLLKLQEGGSSRGHIIRLAFEGSNRVRPAGRRELPHQSSFFVGDRSNWRSGVKNVEEVWYPDLYDGVDARFCFSPERGLKYEFLIRPGANPDCIRLRFEDVEEITIDDEGDLLVGAGSHLIREKRPRIYQQGHEIPGLFVLHDNCVVSYLIDDYDSTQELLIDPSLSYSTYVGGSGYDFGYGIAVDSDGDAYVTGKTHSTDFPTTTGVYGASLSGAYDIFVAKLNSAGTDFSYSTYIGGSNHDIAYAVAVDSDENVYITGETRSTDFPTTNGAYDTSTSSTYNGFVTKLNASGTSLEYSTYLGNVNVTGYGIAVDSNGNAFVTGLVSSSNFPTTSGCFDGSYNGGMDAFVTKLNSSGSDLTYSTYLGGTTNDVGEGLSLDSNGNAYIAGYTLSTNFPTVSGSFDCTNNGGHDAFVTKLNSSGTALSFSTYIGGSSDDYAYAIDLDSDTDSYVTGQTASSDFPTAAAGHAQTYDTSLGGSNDVFATKLNSSGSSLVYSTYIGGGGVEEAHGIAVDGNEKAHITGQSKVVLRQSPYPTTYAAYDTLPNIGTYDVFYTKLDDLGSSLDYSTFLGGSNDDFGQDIDYAGANGYVTGYTWSTNFPTTSGCVGSSNNGLIDAFAASFDFSSQLLLATTESLHSDSAVKGSWNDKDSTILALVGPFPNPVMNERSVHLYIVDGFTGPVEVRLYDIGGREVARPSVRKALHSRKTVITWTREGSDISPGLYWWRIRCEDQEISRPMVVIR